MWCGGALAPSSPLGYLVTLDLDCHLLFCGLLLQLLHRELLLVYLSCHPLHVPLEGSFLVLDTAQSGFQLVVLPLTRVVGAFQRPFLRTKLSDRRVHACDLFGQTPMFMGKVCRIPAAEVLLYRSAPLASYAFLGENLLVSARGQLAPAAPLIGAWSGIPPPSSWSGAEPPGSVSSG